MLLHKKSIKTFLFIAFLLVFVGFRHAIFPEKIKTDSGKDELAQILRETGDYCEKVKKLSLFYVCKEKVVEKEYIYLGVSKAPIRPVRKSYPIPYLMRELVFGTQKMKIKRVMEKVYSYDYQLIRKSGEMAEKRILLEEDGRKKHKENAKLKEIKYIARYLVFGPVGFLSKSWQDKFNFNIVGKDIIGEREAIIIKTSPKFEMEENNNFGRIWVDEEDYSILKIEWDPNSIKDFEEEYLSSPIGDLRKTVIWNVTYGVEKKGVRFPSRQLIQEIFVNADGDKVQTKEITFTYDDYKFFTVEVEVKH